ncbi:MAG: hypothetical protein B6I28_00685 [Fusobacteriia bacterium 4572_132]|nr:MAG: hypothetical protein B6I28_00685 [Fusobacteriia bacterium 4572_132]
MKIALFSDTITEGYGGVTVYVRNLALFLHEQGNDVKIFVWNSKEIKEEEKKFCARFPSFNIIKKVNGKAGFSPIKMINRIRKFNPDIIHNHSQFTMGVHAIFISKLLNVPLLNHYHTYLEQQLNYFPKALRKTKKITIPMIRGWTTKFFDSSDIVIVPTEIIKKYLLEIGVRKRIEVLPFGINLDKFKFAKTENSKFTLLHVGRLTKEKKVEELLYSFEKFSKDKKVTLLIIGDGPEKERLIDLVNELKIDDKVLFKGWISGEKLPQLYNSADVFITLSEMETFGIVVLEAMACGLPVIGANALAIPELVKQGKNGFLVDSKNRIDVANKINILYEDKELRKKMAEESLKYSKEYSKKKVFNKLEKIYASLIK